MVVVVEEEQEEEVVLEEDDVVVVVVKDLVYRGRGHGKTEKLHSFIAS
jgi:hypothetical protein